ncbi:hypothetical protein HN954_04030 [bacterium]|jgi:deoxycytidylate deaminase|nr:hypothetical protein [bacterium]MBT6831744.1 hypothetical protein [bacterium]MBT6996567.1 hypothetical protein [bacterium]MBT7772893.1 hypothetical protein [bacterium]
MSANDLQKLPYLPLGSEIKFLDDKNKFLIAAKKVALEFSKDPEHPTGAVVVRDGKIIGRGANGSDFHEKNGCRRKKLGIPTGKNYELCPGCDPKNHAEQTAIADVSARGKNSAGADLYLWGHFWCCESCWEKMIENGIRDVFLVEGAWKKF